MTMTSVIQSFKVEIAEIDDQHGHLIELIEHVEGGVGEGLDLRQLQEIVARLERYVTVHFTYEERLLREHGYPEFEQHKHEHEVFAAHVHHLARRIQLGHVPRGTEVLGFLKHWLVSHIQGSDRKYAEFLKARGVY